LTTVHVPKRTMGIMAVQSLLQIIKRKEKPVKKMLVPTRLVVRDTTAAIRG
jgi:DNA-binding LacI/PurR family transcriptional regulator